MMRDQFPFRITPEAFQSVNMHAVADQQLLPILRQLHREMREKYGAVKLWREAGGSGSQKQQALNGRVVF